jgi:hypothetical protein
MNPSQIPGRKRMTITGDRFSIQIKREKKE